MNPPPSRWFGRLRPGVECADDGFTLLEVMIASAVMAMIVLSVGGVMVNMGEIGNRAVAGENASTTARTGLLQLQRDLEAANPLVNWTSTVTSYASELQLKLGPTGGTQQTITWSCSSSTLWRDIGTSAGTGVPEVTGVTNCASTTNPVFSYFDEQASNLLANPNSVTAAIITSCSVRINGVVQVSGGSNTTSFTENVSMRLANWQPGTQPCP